MKEYRIDKDAGKGLASSEMRRQLEREGYSVFEWTDSPGAVYPMHEHSSDQSHWVVSGGIELEVEGHGRVVLNAGDRDHMPAGTRHSARVVGPSAVTYLIGERR